MTFVQPTDPDYLTAKRIRQGLTRLDPECDRFIARLAVRFGVAPLTVTFDTVARPRGEGVTPRLAVVLERTHEYQSFLKGSFNYDKDKQREIAGLLTSSIPSSILRANFALPSKRMRAELQPDDIFVCFEDFERVAKWETHNLATGAELDAFTASLGIADQFWCTQRYAGPPIVFVHTADQAEALRAGPLPTIWADTYFEIAKGHDEFGYLSRPEITIEVDSKENFERNYSGNWYYYFK